MNGFGQCPRCGQWGLEHLPTHSHCWECGYSPESNPELRAWQNLEFRKSKFAAQHRAEDARHLQSPNFSPTTHYLEGIHGLTPGVR